jgi:sterol desaturase/sphingolipid hydroxylase (fatty acid hydroxylase superfamily)
MKLCEGVYLSFRKSAELFLARSLYPSVILGCIGVFFVLLDLNAGIYISTYVPVFLGAFLVIAFELLTPYQINWKPKVSDIISDGLFMLVVQVLLPRALSFVVAYSALISLESHSWTFGLWPNGWNIGLQVGLMVLIADFFRYWLHRWMHESKRLWKFHAVHHSPKKLYWLNVGRFHPIDKTLQFFLDALPFIVLGVGEDVLALYFLFYSVNGFFQHCNIELQLGPLNYLISGPQLHRWHHSHVSAEANSNYGNNTIIWDLFFGTYFFPKSRHVEKLGLLNRDFPLDFLSQMQTPFSGDIDRSKLPLRSISESIVNGLLNLRMRLLRRRLYQPFVNNSKNTEKTQLTTLRQILSINSGTEFGRRHHFDSIKCHEDYVQNVPVHEYEDLRPLIEKQEITRAPILTAKPVVMYNQTSGTTGRPKYIPVLQKTLDSLKDSQNLFAFLQYQYCPEAYAGRILGMASPDIEDYLESGTPIGSASGHVYKSMPWLARTKFVVPSMAFSIQDYETKYLVICRLALQHNDITLLASPNPSTFHKLLEIINDNIDVLIDDIATGSCRSLTEVDARTRVTIQRRLHRNLKRAQELESMASRNGRISFADAWPYLKLVTTWTGGSCGISLDSIRPEFPSNTRIADLGYLSSEFRGTITMDTDTNAGVPTIAENFFEFVTKNEWEEGQPSFKCLHQLEYGESYYVFVTTSAGLYRYNMNDIVTVGGEFFTTPTLIFSQKGKGITNITGEKIYESQLIEAMNATKANFEIELCFYQALAYETEMKYRIYIELTNGGYLDTNAVGAYVDSQFQEANMEYETKRASGRLSELEVVQLKPGTGEAYKLHCLAAGQRESQFKPLILQYKKDFSFDIMAHRMP